MFQVRVSAVDVGAARALAERAERADGYSSVGDAVWRDLLAPGVRSLDVVAEVEGRLVAVAHLAVADNLASPHRELGLLAAPEHRDVGMAVDLLGTALAQVGVHETVIAWFPGSPEFATKAASAVGFESQRRLERMERDLPLDLEPVWPDDVEVRMFEPGVDDAAWLAVNNRAFAGHPEQGGWVASTLERRLAEPWFDPDGFLLALRDGELAGFCWTKQHDRGIGEIFVIGVDPAHQGRGLGRALVVAGLHSLHDRGSKVGMLHVDADNTDAVGLYRSLGLEVVRTDAAYVRVGT